MVPGEYFIRLGKSIAGPVNRERIETLWKAGKLPEKAEVSLDKIHWETVKDFLGRKVAERENIKSVQGSRVMPAGNKANSQQEPIQGSRGMPVMKKKAPSQMVKKAGSLNSHWLIPGFLDNSAKSTPLTLQEAIELKSGVKFLRTALILALTIFGSPVAFIYSLLFMRKFMKVRLYRPMIIGIYICFLVSCMSLYCALGGLNLFFSSDHRQVTIYLSDSVVIILLMLTNLMLLSISYLMSGYLHGHSNNVLCPDGAGKFTVSFIFNCVGAAISISIIISMFWIGDFFINNKSANLLVFFVQCPLLLCVLVAFFTGLFLLLSKIDDYIDDCPEEKLASG